MNTLERNRTFVGNASELSFAAVTCSKEMGWLFDTEKTNERLVRYYVSEGVLDKPDRQGREATYSYRHLLQLLNARRMVDNGLSLSVISKYNRYAVTNILEANLYKPLLTEAELLVSTFKMPLHSQKPSLPRLNPRLPPMAIPDVLDEVKRLKDDWMKEIEFVKRLSQDFEHVRSEISQNRDLISRTNDHFNKTLEKLATISVDREAHFMKNIGRMIESQGNELFTSNKELINEIQELRHVFLSELKGLSQNQQNLLENLEVINKKLLHIKSISQDAQ